MYANLDWASLSSRSLCSLLMYACRLRMAHVRVLVGTPLSQYGVVCAICILGVLAGLFKRFHHLLVDPLFHCMLCMCLL